MLGRRYSERNFHGRNALPQLREGCPSENRQGGDRNIVPPQCKRAAEALTGPLDKTFSGRSRGQMYSSPSRSR